MKRKSLKNNILFVGLIGTFLSIVFLVAYFLPNEMGWKIFNSLVLAEKSPNQKEFYFQEAEKRNPEWSLATEINRLDERYQKKEYDFLEKRLKEVEENDCSLKEEKISEFCENVFYLNGLVKYRLGEKEELGKKEEYFNEAVKEFQKTLLVNPQNIWAKENIDFILKKNEEMKRQKQKGSGQEKEKQEEQNGKGKIKNEKDKKGQNKNKENKSGNGEKDKKGKDSQKNENGKDSKEEQKNKNEKKGEKGKRSGNQNQNGGKSRLPNEVNQALKERQKYLEKVQKNGKGFARSKSLAEKNQQENDPFSDFFDDPFFKAFFGDDPFFKPRKRKLKQSITNPDEKDW